MPFLTVPAPRRERYHLRGQRGGIGLYFNDFEYELSSDSTVESLTVEFGPELSGQLPHEFWETVESGVQLGQTLARLNSVRFCCTRFTLVSAKYHDVDTTHAAVTMRVAGCVRSEVAVRYAEPVRPLHADWLTSDVTALARGIHANGALDGLPALTDALLEAGCDHPLALEHLRTCPDHGPSCWVVEMICAQAAARDDGAPA